MQLIIISLITFAGWLSALGIFILAKDLPRSAFIALHYVVDVVLFGAVFYLYFKFSGTHPGAFATMATAMVSLFVLEFILWRFISPETAHIYLNFVDWVIPAFLIASTVYFVGKYFG